MAIRGDDDYFGPGDDRSMLIARARSWATPPAGTPARPGRATRRPAAGPWSPRHTSNTAPVDVVVHASCSRGFARRPSKQLNSTYETPPPRPTRERPSQHAHLPRAALLPRSARSRANRSDALCGPDPRRAAGGVGPSREAASANAPGRLPSTTSRYLVRRAGAGLFPAAREAAVSGPRWADPDGRRLVGPSQAGETSGTSNWWVASSR